MDQPAFEVRVGDRHYRIWANGKAEGFEDGETPVLIVNRIPRVIAEAVKDAQEHPF
jgi:hypothetical protein